MRVCIYERSTSFLGELIQAVAVLVAICCGAFFGLRVAVGETADLDSIAPVLLGLAVALLLTRPVRRIEPWKGEPDHYLEEVRPTKAASRHASAS